jgi:hypothetical protein
VPRYDAPSRVGNARRTPPSCTDTGEGFCPTALCPPPARGHEGSPHPPPPQQQPAGSPMPPDAPPRRREKHQAPLAPPPRRRQLAPGAESGRLALACSGQQGHPEPDVVTRSAAPTTAASPPRQDSTGCQPCRGKASTSCRPAADDTDPQHHPSSGRRTTRPPPRHPPVPSRRPVPDTASARRPPAGAPPSTRRCAAIFLPRPPPPPPGHRSPSQRKHGAPTVQTPYPGRAPPDLVLHHPPPPGGGPTRGPR